MSRQPDHPAIGQFARKMRQKWNSPANAYNAVGTLNRLNAFLADRGTDLLEATTDDLDDYIEWRRQHVCKNTAIGDRTHLRAFYRWASSESRNKWTSSNPAADMVPMSADEPDPLRTHVTDEWEYRALLATCRRKTHHGAQRACDRRDTAILALMWETGCRRAEVTKVDMRHVNLREGIIHLVGTKGRGGLKARDVILGDEAADAISFYVFGPGGRGDHDGPLFESIAYLPGTNRRRPLRPDSVGLMLQRRAEEANKTQRLPAKIRGLAHGFRRASAINDIDDGISARSIQHQKGWKQDGRMLARYTRAAETRQSHDEYRTKRGRRQHLQAVDDD